MKTKLQATAKAMRAFINKAIWLLVKKPAWKAILIWGPWVVILLLTAFYGFENWRGKKAWNAAQAKAMEMGISLSLEDNLDPTVPDSHNIFLVEPDIALRLRTTTRLSKSKLSGLSSEHGAFRNQNSRRRPWKLNTYDLRKWLPKHHPATTQREAAEYIAPLVQDRCDLLDEIYHLPLDYKFSAELSNKPSKVLTYDHYRHFKEIINFRNLVWEDARVAVGLGDSARLVRRIRQSTHAQERFSALQGLRFRKFIDGAKDMLWEGIKADLFSTDELILLHQFFTEFDASESYASELEGSLAFYLRYAEHAERNPDIIVSGFKGSAPRFWSDPVGSTRIFFWNSAYRLAPKGWYLQARARLLNDYLRLLEHRPFNSPDLLKQLRRAERANMNDYKPNQISFRYLNPYLIQILREYAERLAQQLTIRSLAITAIELELHKRQTGSYPADLSLLDHSRPIDFATGEVFQYGIKDDGTPLLWSIGPDGINEQGVVGDDKTVWQLTATDGESARYQQARRARIKRLYHTPPSR